MGVFVLVIGSVQLGFHYFVRSLSLWCLCCASNEALAVIGWLFLTFQIFFFAIF